MVHIWSNMSLIRILDYSRLLRVAHQAICSGLQGAAPDESQSAEHRNAVLNSAGSSFVSLYHKDRLRGCIGSLDWQRPLLDDVAHNAYAAAFQDPRFAALQPSELDELILKVAILSPPIALRFTTERELVAQLEPGRDGLILSLHGRRATFLPAVWEVLPEPSRFIAELKHKAGWTKEDWDPAASAWRYGAMELSCSWRDLSMH